jgi:hypothetical protein
MSESDTKLRVSLYVEKNGDDIQVVEKSFESASRAFEKAEELLADVEQNPHISSGDYCYVQVDRHAGKESTHTNPNN